ncbi:uncharacterized protein [Ptychodera flava]|uniref:uncharacterized protein n=1 Tax=Ptychodera flava TaxID=63121 RepID=UPI003969E193
MADLKATIEACNVKFMERYSSGDMKGLSELYTEDCQFMPPGSETKTGRKAVEEAFGAMKPGVAKITLNTEEVGGISEGDVAFERGNFTMSKEDGSSAGVGKYLVIWKNVGGVYHLHIDCFNTN